MKLKEPFNYSWLDYDIQSMIQKIELYQIATKCRLGSKKLWYGDYTLAVEYTRDDNTYHIDNE